MNLKKLILTENACCKANNKITVKGIMVHSTGANNPFLKRYVGPNDGLLGENQYNNHWNQPYPDGQHICVHAFIGKLEDGSAATYQTLPWDIKGWHSGSGDIKTAQKNGFAEAIANSLGYIGFEICEDDLTDSAYFNQVYREAIDLCAYLCKKYGIKPESPYLICHSEGNKLGIASAHADVMHWFPKFGKSMDTFRADVTEKLKLPSQTSPKPPSPKPSKPPESPKSSVAIKVGDIVQFTGGNVYTSSQADKPAGTRPPSRCKVTSIHNGTHSHHVISEDGKGVYGWVDLSCLSK